MSNTLKGFAVVLALTIGFFASDIFSWISGSSGQPLTEYCQLSTQPCMQNDAVISISQDSAEPQKPFNIVAQWPHSTAKTLLLTLKGHEMEMGTARFILNQDYKQQYSGELLLPACTSKNMTWIGELSDGEESIYVAIRMAR